ncbi:SPARC-related modular calcium-binding protein 2-like, partial [Homarus americanus]
MWKAAPSVLNHPHVDPPDPAYCFTVLAPSVSVGVICRALNTFGPLGGGGLEAKAGLAARRRKKRKQEEEEKGMKTRMKWKDEEEWVKEEEGEEEEEKEEEQEEGNSRHLARQQVAVTRAVNVYWTVTATWRPRGRDDVICLQTLHHVGALDVPDGWLKIAISGNKYIGNPRCNADMVVIRDDLEHHVDCNVVCQDNSRDPVCGTNGQTFDSICDLDLAEKCLDERRAKQEQLANGESVYVPTCLADGSYAAVQCHNFTSYCWCSRLDGKPIPQTIQKERSPQCVDRTSPPAPESPPQGKWTGVVGEEPGVQAVQTLMSLSTAKASTARPRPRPPQPGPSASLPLLTVRRVS